MRRVGLKKGWTLNTVEERVEEDVRKERERERKEMKEERQKPRIKAECEEADGERRRKRQIRS